MPDIALNGFPIPAAYVVKLLVDMRKSNARFATIVGLFALLAPAYAQWLYPDPNSPRTRDGKPVLTAPASRMSGKPVLTAPASRMSGKPDRSINQMLQISAGVSSSE